MKKEYAIHVGTEFTLEWYFNEAGKSEVFEYVRNLPQSRQKKIVHIFTLLGELGALHNKEKFRYEGDQIFAIKASEDRLLCFFYVDAKIIITNAYQKQSMRMPVREKERASRARADYIRRCEKGIYYE